MVQERRVIHFTGTVQGVGFRWNTLRALQGGPVTGFVRNLPDGRVCLVMEGEPGQLDAAAAAIRERLGRCIDHEEVEISPATGEFSDFGVAR